VVTSRRQWRVAVQLSTEYGALPTIGSDAAGDGRPRLEMVRFEDGAVGDDDLLVDAFEVVQ
jgi:hypothetical protein